MIPAQFTNAATNFLHVLLLLWYLLSCYRHHRSGNVLYGQNIIALFTLLLIGKLLGILIHLVPPDGLIRFICGFFIRIDMMLVILSLMTSIEMPRTVVQILIPLSVLMAVLSICYYTKFQFVAISSLVLQLICAFYSRHKIRLALLTMAASSITWIILRVTGDYLFDGDLPIELRYDNDIYHFGLMIGTYMLYQSINEVQWKRSFPWRAT